VINVVDNTDADTVPVTLKSPVTKELRRSHHPQKQMPIHYHKIVRMLFGNPQIYYHSHIVLLSLSLVHLIR
jgi:hypothetical protein